MAVTVKIPTQLRAATDGAGRGRGLRLDRRRGARRGLRRARRPARADHPGRRPAPLRQRLRLRRGHPLPAGPRDGDQRGRRGDDPAGRRRRLGRGSANFSERSLTPRGVEKYKTFTPAGWQPPVVILCGGRGTRLRERTESVPKALVEIGGRPILWHVIEIYAAQGFERFVLATGYLGEMVEEFAAAEHWPDRVSVECVDTGLDTPTGGRIARLAERLDGGTFCATYADGVADVDLGALLDFHRGHGALATMTVVRPHLQWGVAELDGDRVEGFVEKPRSEHWINGGFFCFEPGALDYLDEGQRAGARAAGAPRRRRAAPRPPPRGLLGLHGHLQGRGRPQRPLGARRGSLAALGRGRGRGRGEAGARHRRPRLRRLAPGAGAARARRRGHRPRPGAAAASRGWRCRASSPRSSWSRPICATRGRSARRWRRASSTSSSTSPRRPWSGRRWPTPRRPSRPTSRGTWNLLEACRRADVPAVVVASSDKAYGPHERAALPRGLAAATGLAV